MTFSQKIPNPEIPDVFDILPEELVTKLEACTLIDVRQPEEYTGELGHIEGTQLIPLSEIPNHIQNISTQKPIVFICRSGARSARAASFALENGFSDVYNMKGGMLRWNQLNFKKNQK